jgi:hypothetical protein
VTTRHEAVFDGLDIEEQGKEMELEAGEAPSGGISDGLPELRKAVG